MEELIKNIVQHKNVLERQIERKNSLRWIQRIRLSLLGITNHLYSEYRVAINPSSFARHVFPFAEIYSSYDSMKMMEIDPYLVLGGTYKNYSTDSTNGKNIIHYLNQITEDFVTGKISTHPELARYCKIGKFPVFIALEGKNRVELFRRYNHHIKAVVTETSYPLPHEIIVHRTKPFKIFYAKHIRTNKKTIILFPSLTIPILKKYGVKIIDVGIDLKSIIDYRSTMLKLTNNQMLP